MLYKEMALADASELVVAGWHANGRMMIVLRPHGTATEVLEVEESGAPRLVGTIADAFAGTARVDPSRHLLYVTVADPSGVHNLRALDLQRGTIRSVTDNVIPGVSFADLVVMADGTLLCARQQRNEDLWVIRYDH